MNETGLLGFLFIFFDLDDLTALVLTAIRADGVRQAHGAAIRAGHQIARLKCVMRAATIAAAFGVLTFWLWGHSVLLIDMQPPGKARRDFQTSGQIIVASGSDVKTEPK